MNLPNVNVIFKSCLKIEKCAACHAHSQESYYVTCERPSKTLYWAARQAQS